MNSHTTLFLAVLGLFSSPGLSQPQNDETEIPSDNSIMGTTTRFWDCCKPSCAWNRQADVDSPVKSCAADGQTPIGTNEKSGCNGGPSFSCDSYQPWAVNETFSYGFAAARIHGQNESNWCCACYEIAFTEASLSGKKMIVQAINSGGIGKYNLNLQIPGGGVARSNGCQRQWGTNQTGWGEAFGGVAREEECSTLPLQLRNGCKWRFQWLKNVGNPPIEFKRVECPKELTSISGCNRNDQKAQP